MSVPILFSRWRPGLLALPILTAASAASAHEAWLLTPAEIETLAAEPMPWIFQSWSVLLTAAGVGSVMTAAALIAEEHFRDLEARLAAPIASLAQSVGALILRLGLAVMLILAATGGLPRHGVQAWTEPTFFVPDMQLSLVPGWDWLIVAQVALGTLLVLGFAVRAVGFALILLSGLGLALFGGAFLSYAPHFAAPGLMLLVMGGGTWAVDRLLEDRPANLPWYANAVWRLAQVLVGLGFVYLAVAYKLTQPTLLIAILEHGDFPSFGLPLAWIALAMTLVEIVCGILMALGRLTRPVALILVGAISFLALTLGETPLFHGNLYGIMVVFALTGRELPERAVQGFVRLRRLVQ